jgi:hypothetical protein
MEFIGQHILESSIHPGSLRRIILAVGQILALAVLCADLPKFLFSGNAASGEPVITEYEVKAAYVFNFAKFVEWPANAFTTRNAPFAIGVIGNDEFSTLLGDRVKNKTLQEHPIVVRSLKRPVDLRTCNIVFIGASEQKRLQEIIEDLRERPVLTVTEVDEDLPLGKGIMNLVVEGGRVQFEVDIARAEKAHLQISSKLLRLALVRSGKNRGK